MSNFTAEQRASIEKCLSVIEGSAMKVSATGEVVKREIGDAMRIARALTVCSGDIVAATLELRIILDMFLPAEESKK
jgi:hypothetical protein